MAANHQVGPVILWDIDTGERLAELAPSVLHSTYSTEYLAFAEIGNGRYLFGYSGVDAAMLTTVDIEVGDEPFAGERRQAAPHVIRAAVDGVPALASAGIAAPLSVVADLVQLTGGHGVGERLAMLAEHRGVARLRALGWPSAARVGFAALLAEQAEFDPAFAAPEATVPQLRQALDGALRAAPATHRSVTVPVGALVAAAEEVSEQTVTLLALLGPEAVQADPTLPVRTRHLAAALPVLDPRAHAAITDIPRQVSAQLDARAASARSSAGTVGLRRRGEPRNLLRTQLALPPELFRLEQARGSLLYRLHEGEPRLVLERTVLVLDNTPPAFGPMEIALRLVAHGIAQLLLKEGQEAAVVTLDRPGQVTPLRRTADLMALWTTRTLEPPDLATAMHTASGAGMAVTVVLTMRHAAEDHGLTGRPGLRVVTTHAPGESAGRDAASSYLVRVPPRPTAADVGRAVVAVLTGGEGR
nr:hypothetical protein GCM10020063_018800 [Dactylosporangium thailandense]